MKGPTMTRFFAIALSALSLAACGQPDASTKTQTAGPVAVADAVCRPTPNGRDITGCYLTLTAPQADTLVSISTPVATSAQVHEMRMENNMMSMAELKDGLPLPAGQAVSLAPGGNHIMLMGVTSPLKAGDTVPLTLTFAEADPVEVTASVGQPAV